MGTRPLEGPDVDKFLSICCRKEHNTPPVFERVPVGMQMLLTADVSLKGKTVVLPAITFGNVGQLAVDLLVSTAQLRCIGYLRDPISVLPCVGSESDGKKWIPATELQLYGRPEYDWIVLQQRAPAALGKQVGFALSLARLLKAADIAQVVMLGSLSKGDQASVSKTCPAAPYFKSTTEEAFQEYGWHCLMDVDPTTDIAYTDQASTPWPFWRACKSETLPLLVLLLPVHEGDNVQDGMQLASECIRLKSLFSKAWPLESPIQWHMPASWAALYGIKRSVY